MYVLWAISGDRHVKVTEVTHWLCDWSSDPPQDVLINTVSGRKGSTHGGEKKTLEKEMRLWESNRRVYGRSGTVCRQSIRRQVKMLESKQNQLLSSNCKKEGDWIRQWPKRTGTEGWIEETVHPGLWGEEYPLGDSCICIWERQTDREEGRARKREAESKLPSGIILDFRSAKGNEPGIRGLSSCGEGGGGVC